MSWLSMYCENEEKRKLWMAVELIESAVEEVADVRVRLSALSFSRFCSGLWQMIWGLLVVDDKMQFSMLQYNCQLSANLSQQLSFSCSLSSEWKQKKKKNCTEKATHKMTRGTGVAKISKDQNMARPRINSIERCVSWCSLVLFFQRYSSFSYVNLTSLDFQLFLSKVTRGHHLKHFYQYRLFSALWF